jgi:mannan endo-1,4-beta-mannosidase
METDSQGHQQNHLWYRGFYTDSTKFDLQKAIDNPNSKDYALLLSDIDAIAIQLKKMSDANVPVLWRPLHEAEGGWFWWGAKGPGPFKKLWRLMYDRLTNYHHLHNLIWVDCSGTNPDWYPGDKYVDIIGIDAYPSDEHDTQTESWKTLLAEYGGRKPLALTEYGGVPDVPDMRKIGVDWLYFVSWTNDLGPKKNGLEWDKRIYTWPTVINEDRLPKFVK